MVGKGGASRRWGEELVGGKSSESCLVVQGIEKRRRNNCCNRYNSAYTTDIARKIVYNVSKDFLFLTVIGGYIVLSRSFCFFIVSLIFLSELRADLVLTDTFSYPDGLLPSPWNLFSGTGGQTVVSGRLRIDDAGTGDYARSIGTLTSGSVFAGFDLNVDAADLPSSAAGQYFSLFAQESSGMNANFVSRVFLATATGGFQIGIARGSGTGATTTFAPGVFLAGTTYRVVHGFNIDTNVASLGIDTSGGPTLTSSTGDTDPTQLTLFAFRISGTSDGDKFVDNLTIATTYTEAFVAVPEPSSIALISLVGFVGLTFSYRANKKGQ